LSPHNDEQCVGELHWVPSAYALQYGVFESAQAILVHAPTLPLLTMQLLQPSKKLVQLLGTHIGQHCPDTIWRTSSRPQVTSSQTFPEHTPWPQYSFLAGTTSSASFTHTFGVSAKALSWRNFALTLRGIPQK